jgi:hypothetical protein
VSPVPVVDAEFLFTLRSGCVGSERAGNLRLAKMGQKQPMTSLEYPLPEYSPVAPVYRGFNCLVELFGRDRMSESHYELPLFHVP